MEFNLKNAPESRANNGDKSYQKPGIYENLVVTEVTLNSSSLNHIPYIELKTKGVNNEIGKSNRMWLSTMKSKDIYGNEKKYSGWEITQRNLLDLIVATHNVSRDEAENMMAVNDDSAEMARQKLINKLSTLLVGRPFRGKFKGEQAKPRQDGTPGLIYATLDLVESMSIPKEVSALRFNSSKDIKMYESQDVPTTNGTTNDLPF